MLRSVTFAIALLASAAVALAQIRLPDVNPGGLRLPSLSDLTRGEAPLTTTTKDAPELGWLDFAEIPFDDPRALTNADRAEDGTYLLTAGRYTVTLHSFCGQGYSHGPSRGMGYVAAGWRGSKAGLLRTIVERYSRQTEVSQEDVQVLIWAILSRTKPQDIKGRPREALLKLMGEDGVKLMAQGALDAYGEQLIGRLFQQADPALRPLLEFDNRMRGMLREGNVAYGEFSRLAVLQPTEDLRSEVPEGTWQLHPQGFLLRYRPQAYSKLTVDILVPRRMTKVRDDRGRVSALTWDDGLRVDITYAPQAPIPVASAPGVVAHVITKVAVSAPGQETVVKERPTFVLSGRRTSARHGQATWLRWFRPVQDPEIIEIDLEEIAEAEARAAALGDRIDTYWNWYERAERVDRGEGPGEGLFEGSHLWDMMKSLFEGPGERIGVIADTHGRMMEHLVDATRTLESMGEGDGDGGGSRRYDPSGHVAAPGNGGSQRILPSSRSFD